MTIGELSKAAGIAPSAIRFYESTGILQRPRRKNGIRDYDRSAVEEIKILMYLRNSGISVRSLAAQDLETEIERRIEELDSEIARSKAMKAKLEQLLACRCHGERPRCVIFAS